MPARSLFTPEPSGPVANAADGVKGQSLGACVLPAQETTVETVLHLGTRDELLAGEGVGEVAHVQTLDVAVRVNSDLSAEWDINGLHSVKVIIVRIIIIFLRQLTSERFLWLSSQEPALWRFH